MASEAKTRSGGGPGVSPPPEICVRLGRPQISTSPQGGGSGAISAFRNGTIAFVAAATLACASTPVLPQDAAQIAAGRMVWRDAGCDGCHGANGQGGTSPDLPNGPSIRATKLDRKGLADVISCGRPGTQMAAWLDGAYTKAPCMGTATGPVPADLVVVGAYSTADIAALTDFLIATFVGK